MQLQNHSFFYYFTSYMMTCVRPYWILIGRYGIENCIKKVDSSSDYEFARNVSVA